MNHLRTRILFSLSGGVLCFLTSGLAHGQIVERLDKSSAGVPGDVAADRAVISDDGQYAAFLSRASNLVLPDDTTSIDVYLRDRASGITVRIAQNVAQTTRLEMSGDGSTIVYGVAHPGAPQPFNTTFRYDRQQQTTFQLATSLGDTLPGAITPDAHWMALIGRSAALPLVFYNGYRLDLQTGTLLVVAVNMQGAPANVLPDRPVISADGDGVVFTSLAGDIVPGPDQNGESDIFLFHVSSSTVERISETDTGVIANRESRRPSISRDGTQVAFASNSTNLDAFVGPPPLFFSVFVRDVVNHTTRRISAPTVPASDPGSGDNPLISADGRFIAYESSSTNIVPGHGGLSSEVFVRDQSSEVTRAATPAVTGPNQNTMLQSMSGDGRLLALRSTNLTLPDAGATGGAYLADFGPGCSSQGYCTALPNSTGVPASIGAQGEASRQLNNFTLSALDLPPNAIAIFASGTAAIDPGVPFGNGLRCIGGTMTRYHVLHATLGVVIDYQDLSSPIYAGVQPGSVRYYQCVYRDLAAGGAGFNTTDAVAVTFCF